MYKKSLGIFVAGNKQKSIQRHPIITTDADYDYILDETERREKIEFERNVIVNSDGE